MMAGYPITRPLPSYGVSSPAPPSKDRSPCSAKRTLDLGFTVGCTYLARNRVNGKGYVGKTTKSLKARRLAHENSAKNIATCRICPYFHAALLKYGIQNFEWSVLFESDWEEELNVAEVHFIAALGTKAPFGYNLTDGGEGRSGFHHSEEFNAQTSARFRGKSKSAEQRAKMSAAMKGRKFSAEHRAKLAAAKRGRRLSSETREKMSGRVPWNKGKATPQEVKAKISASKKGTIPWNKTLRTHESPNSALDQPLSPAVEDRDLPLSVTTTVMG
jgi:group I intron endonuclease